MSANYQKVEQAFDPQTVSQKMMTIEEGINQGFKQVGRLTPSNANAVLKEFSKFYQAFMSTIFHCVYPSDYVESEVRVLVDKAHRQGGYNGAVRSVLCGDSLMEILSEIANELRREYTSRYFDTIRLTMIPQLDYEERLKLTRILLEKIKQFSPSSYQYNRPEALVSDFENLLHSYAEALRSYRKLGLKCK